MQRNAVAPISFFYALIIYECVIVKSLVINELTDEASRPAKDVQPSHTAIAFLPFFKCQYSHASIFQIPKTSSHSNEIVVAKKTQY